MTPDPINTARTDFAEFITAFNESANDAWRMTYAIDSVSAALDLAEKLKDERDEALATRDQLYCDTEELMQKLTLERLKVTRLTSQLEQAERVIDRFVYWHDRSVRPDDSDNDGVIVKTSDLRAASQWIKDRQAKTDGEAS